MATALAVQYSVKYTLTGPDGTVVTFNDSTDPNYVGILDPSESSGLDSPEVREDTSFRVEDDGAIQGINYYGARPVVLTGIIMANSVVQRNERVGKLLQATNAMRADCKLEWQPEGAPQKVKLMLRRQQPVRVTKGFVKAFQVSLVSNDPRIYGVNGIATFIPEGGGMKTSTKAPGTVSNQAGIGSVAWTTPENVKVSDNVYASAALGAAAGTNYLQVTNFGFAIPETARIMAIKVLVERKAETTVGIETPTTKLWNGTEWVGSRASDAVPWPLVEETKEVLYYEWPNGINGKVLNLTPAIVNNANFGIRMALVNNGAGAATAKIDQVQIKIEYQNTAVITNEGNAETPLEFKILGPSSPSANQLVISRYIQGSANLQLLFEKTNILLAGHEAVINTENRTATVDGVSIYGNLVFTGSEWFGLAPGVNEFAISASALASIIGNHGWI